MKNANFFNVNFMKIVFDKSYKLKISHENVYHIENAFLCYAHRKLIFQNFMHILKMKNCNC